MHRNHYDHRLFLDRSVETFIRLALITLLVAWCFEIVRPFIVPIVWGIIIAIGLYPGYQRLIGLMGGRRVGAAVVICLLSLIMLIIPAALLSGSLVEGVHRTVQGFEEGTQQIPALPSWVARLPLFGDDIDHFWREASSNLRTAFMQIEPQLKAALKWLLQVAAGAGLGILHFLFAIAIAGVLLARAEDGQRGVQSFAQRLAGARGQEFATLAGDTIRSVTRGILGVALIQSLLAGLGWLAIGVPAAGLWALLALLLSTVQIGILPITLPILIYAFLHLDPLAFIVFLVWSLLVGVIDNLLKPILLGQGVDVPMAVIFVGAIGGFLSSGIIGLFVGAVVLVLGYKLFLAWLHGGPVEPAAAPSATLAQPDAHPTGD